MRLKELIEERDILIKELKELDEISRSGQNEQKVKDYKYKLYDLHSEILEILGTVPIISVKEFNDMIKQIFKTKYNIDAKCKILKHAFTKRRDFVLSLKRENSSSFDKFILESQSVRRKFIFDAKQFFLIAISLNYKSREWKELTNKYPEFKDVLLEVISQAKINELSKNKALIARLIESKNKLLLHPEIENSTRFKTGIEHDIEENRQQLDALETEIDSWKL